ncbi:glycosyltransferase [Fragilaria crotonensis]|nr:glycosyltransferase [Fragilaria crotonensis]
MSTAVRSRYIRWLLSALLLVFLLHRTARLEANAVSSFIGNDYQYFAELLASPSSVGQGTEGRLTMTQLMEIHAPTCHDNDILHLSSVPSQYHQNQQHQQSSRTRIPKVIHQADFDFTCHDGDEDVTDDNNDIEDKQAFKDIVLQWKNLPNFHYVFHTRPQMEAFVYQDWPEFPHLISISMHCIPQRQGFVDLWKALILWEFGGGVVDYDWVPKPQDNDNDDNNDNFQDLIQPDDQAILFMDVRATFAEPHDRYTSILLMEPKHPLAYYLVLGILSRISHHRHLNSITHADWAFLSGSQVLDFSFVYFTVVDTSDAGFRMRHHNKLNRRLPPGFENSVDDTIGHSVSSMPWTMSNRVILLPTWQQQQ